jgi:hypothetical protein
MEGDDRNLTSDDHFLGNWKWCTPNELGGLGHGLGPGPVCT